MQMKRDIMMADYDCDTLIIGAGVAGALLARELTAAGDKVMILEAGNSVNREEATQRYRQAWNRKLEAPYEAWGWASIPDSEKPSSYYGPYVDRTFNPLFLKAVGGSTWHWTGITPRFLPSDFALHSRYGVGVDWPISYDEIEPYYVLAERALGVAGDSNDPQGSPRSAAYPMKPIPLSYSDRIIARKLASMDLDVAPFPAARNSQPYDGRPACRGNGTCTPLCPIGASYSADHDIRKAIRMGASLISQAVAYRLQADDQGNIHTIHYKTPDKTEHTLKARRTVLACNTIETARLLLMSRDNVYPGGIANRSGMVGRNLMDHTIFVTAFRMREPIYAGRGPQSIATIRTGRDGPFRKQHAAAKLFISNDVNIHQYMSRILDHQEQWPEALSLLRDQVIHIGHIGAEIEQLPDPNNRLELDTRRPDPLGLPLPTLHFHSSKYTLDGLKIWRERVADMIRHMGARIEETSVSYSSHHPAGTTRMGENPATSVVNRHCRSHDHPNLYMVGGHVFPTMGTANPTLTIAALSLRLADHLKRKG